MRVVPTRFDESAVDAIFADLDQSQLAGAAVGIAIGGDPVYRKGFGLCNMELPVTLSPQTRMRIFSATKQFTCLAYLLLCEEGKAELDDPVAKFLPDIPGAARGVTIRQLMTHTSGIRDACDIRWLFSGIQRSVPATDIVDLYRTLSDTNFRPGSAWCYNNGSFYILSALIEKLSDDCLERVLHRRVFEPVGMYDSFLRCVDTDFVPRSASMHMTVGGGAYKKQCLPGELSGGGGVVSTVDDMLRWMKHMQRPHIGSAETWTLMTTSQKLSDGIDAGYGLGLFLCPYRGLRTISHSGRGLGGSSQMVRIPAADLNVVVIVNREDSSATQLAARILDVCLGITPRIARPPGECVSGLFQSSLTGRVIRLYSQSGAQMAAIDGTAGLRLTWVGPEVLHSDPSEFTNLVITLRGEPRQPTGIHFQFFGHHDELPLISLDDGPTGEVIAGEYYSDSIKVHVKVGKDAHGYHIDTLGQFGAKRFALDRLAAALWLAKPVDATPWTALLARHSDSNSLTLRTARNWQISLRRC